ncbi:MAG: RpiB/LacA/LacB family sugar-phosphate isomerase, partial [Candidatus Aminicenantes bacterium]|nr:RpiB/LacA/LacB family sugar-phosphate isomerase [Candidatus Aminicenantes bacterium]
MRIALGSDHAGYEMKAVVAGYLSAVKTDFEDFGSRPGEVADYVDHAAAACRAVLEGTCDRAILFCGTGIGMAMAANKFPGIRATVCWSRETAEVSR